MKKLINNVVKFSIFISFIFVFAGGSLVLANDFPWWEFQSVDTMKFSRDLAREKMDSVGFEEVMRRQVYQISQTGVTHIAIATPYDEEFVPFLTKWVDEARKYDLNIWFRGNFSGWEEWFGYDSITREEHLEKTLDFIKNNNELFKNGDVFSPCPECENGGTGDPRHNGDVDEYREFLIKEYSETTNLFRDLGLSVRTNYASMNADVAKLVMDEETTKAMGGIVVIDHFKKTPKQVDDDINEIAKISKGRVVLGEFGAPIPDINGRLNETEQNEWVDELLKLLTGNENLLGLNYWVSYGGTTSIWKESGEQKKAVGTLTKYFKPVAKPVKVYNELEKPLKDIRISHGNVKVKTDNNGEASIKILDDTMLLDISGEGYIPKTVLIDHDNDPVFVTLEKENKSIIFRVRELIKNIYKLLSFS
jgi:hypothetical protein